MMSKIEAPVYPDAVFRNIDIGLRVCRPLAGLRYGLIFHRIDGYYDGNRFRGAGDIRRDDL